MNYGYRFRRYNRKVEKIKQGVHAAMIFNQVYDTVLHGC